MYWNRLSAVGGSRRVAFYVDGDGNFHPRCKLSFKGNIPQLTEEMKEAAVVEDRCGHRVYDYDPVAWVLHSDRGSK